MNKTAIPKPLPSTYFGRCLCITSELNKQPVYKYTNFERPITKIRPKAFHQNFGAGTIALLVIPIGVCHCRRQRWRREESPEDMKRSFGTNLRGFLSSSIMHGQDGLRSE
jgi:hypothetical protein